MGRGVSAGRCGWVLPGHLEGPQFHDPPFSRGLALPRVTCLSRSVSCLAGPLCPGAAMRPPSSSPPRRTLPWGQSSSTKWTPAASTTSTRRSSACFPRCRFGQGRLGRAKGRPHAAVSGSAHGVWHPSSGPSAPTVLALVGLVDHLSTVNANRLLFE